jgi:hypothetical protein
LSTQGTYPFIVSRSVRHNFLFIGSNKAAALAIIIVRRLIVIKTAVIRDAFRSRAFAMIFTRFGARRRELRK